MSAFGLSPTPPSAESADVLYVWSNIKIFYLNKLSLQNLLRECPRMEHADLSFCRGIDLQAYLELQAEFPQVEICCCNHLHHHPGGGEGARTASRNGSENG